MLLTLNSQREICVNNKGHTQVFYFSAWIIQGYIVMLHSMTEMYCADETASKKEDINNYMSWIKGERPNGDYWPSEEMQGW